MARSFIPASVQELWSVWNIRGFVILSLFLQVLLASIARLRKKSNNWFLVLVIWSAYFMADWAATFTFGLISNAQRNNSINPPEVDENHMAFWAAFLLIHLGGPDTITAFSLEDNALWMRHLVGLVAQLSTFFYIFLKTLPGNNLAMPTILIAVTGAIKYGGRTRALYLASMENLKKSTGKQPDTSPDIIVLGGGDAAFQMRRESSRLFQILKGLVVDITPDHAERSKSRNLILGKGAREAFDMMVTELDFLYELFYTKILAVNSLWGLLTRMVTYYNVIAAIILYCLSKKEGFHETDIWITYFMLTGIIILETFSEFMLLLSYRAELYAPPHPFCFVAQYICFIIPCIVVIPVIPLFDVLSRHWPIIRKSWCEKLGAFNLLSHCFGQYWREDNKLKKYAHTISRLFARETNGGISRNAFDDDIRNFIFDELKGRAIFADDADKVKTIFEARGGWTLSNSGNNPELMRYVSRFDYDRSLLTWHIATEICYNTDGAVDATELKHRKLARILSDYMNYVLIKKSEMMSAVAGIGHIRYRDTCTEITHFRRLFESKTVNKFCARVVDELTSSEPAHEYKDKSASVLSDACNLAKALRPMDKKWEIISRVWMEVLMYAAGHCRPEKHARALCEGGELVTIVWLLMAHFGIGPHFPYPED